MRLLRIAGCAIAMTALAIGCNEPPTAVDDVESAFFKKGGNPGGGGITWLTTGAAGKYDYWPCFLPDGNTVVFNRGVTGGTKYDLYAVDLPSGSVTDLAVARDAARSSCSPTADRIAFTEGTWDFNALSVWVREVSGDVIEVLWTNGSPNSSWYPDGIHLAVEHYGGAVDLCVPNPSLCKGPNDHVVMRVAVDGSESPVALTDPSIILAGVPSVSPHNWLAFAGQLTQDTVQDYHALNNSVWVAPLAGDPASKTYMEVSKGMGQAPEWSPDGEWVAYQKTSTQPIGRSYAIFIVHVIDSNGNLLPPKKRRPRRVTSYELDAVHPRWSPDGTQLVFAARHPDGGRSIGVMDRP